MVFKPRALVFMGEDKNRKTLYDRLSKMGLKVDLCGTQAEAIQHLDERHYNLLLLQDSLGLPVLEHFCNHYDYLRHDYIDHRDRQLHPRFITCIIVAGVAMTLEEANTHYFEYRRIMAAETMRIENTLGSELIGSLLERLADNNRTYVRALNGEKLRFIESFDVPADHRSDPEQVVGGIIDHMWHKFDLTPIMRQSLMAEFLDLLHRLLYNYQRADIMPLRGGYSGGSVMLVRPYQPDSRFPLNTRVIKIDRHQVVYREFSNFLNFIRGTVPDDRNASAQDYYRTTRLGGILYSFIGIGNDKPLSTFEDVYFADQDRLRDPAYAHSDPDHHGHLRHVIDTLFTNTCERWYQQLTPPYSTNLAQDYRKLLNIRRTKIEPVIRQFDDVELNGDHLRFTALEDHPPYRNPLLYGLDLKIERHTHRCIMHGDMNARNILLNEVGASWLIDFQFSGRHHPMHDLASLDTALRIQFVRDLPGLPAPDLASRSALDDALLTASSITQLTEAKADARFEHPLLKRSYEMVLHLRRHVVNYLAQHHHAADLLEYYVPLFYYTLRTVQFNDLNMTQRKHALLSASKLAAIIEANS